MDKIITYIVSLLEENILSNHGIKAIYKGDPIYIPQNDLPCVIVQPNSTVITSLDTAEDQASWNISISVVSDDRTHINSTGDEEIGQFYLTKVMEEKDSNNKLKTSTIVDVIRNTLDSNSEYVVRTTGYTVDYTFRMRSARYSSDVNDYYPTIEATLTFTADSIGYLRD